MTHTAWDAFWSALPAEPGAALWDSSPELTAARHLPLFRDRADPLLPLVDLGCGNGRQTQWLADHFPRVVGLDIAESAVALAARTHPAPNVAYRRADLLDHGTAAALHTELGDVNVYMRGVLHQLDQDDRVRLLDSIAVLLGASGLLFAQELTEHTGWYVSELLATGAALPKTAGLAAHFGFGARLAPACEGQLRLLFEKRGFEVVADGDIALHTTENSADGRPLQLPTSYLVARSAADARNTAARTTGARNTAPGTPPHA
ncbi:class I SAM-dependent methyltransferase [Streptomyces montanisoli]|uniref:Class I SAM-dependent methyltransferase n=1 Tax=Streptomyces montanisoli TaxID=2798581 RepID=A0A940M9J5_9ACTN|nr:class I SAM-dependent methyltransferase [Streptomyces montanisoli]MBP0456401.1 class I SAM-dependent methyltransferase [Streptomyces montanisoli]